MNIIIVRNKHDERRRANHQITMIRSILISPGAVGLSLAL